MKAGDKIVHGLGLCGFLIAAALGIYSSFSTFSPSPSTSEVALGLVSFMLCPPSLLFVLCIDCEGGQQLPMWAIIAILNYGLYAAVGLLVLWLRRLDARTPR
jgi:hypothetical protein